MIERFSIQRKVHRQHELNIRLSLCNSEEGSCIGKEKWISSCKNSFWQKSCDVGWQHATSGGRAGDVSHLNWKCCESNLWPSPSSSEGFLIGWESKPFRSSLGPEAGTTSVLYIHTETTGDIYREQNIWKHTRTPTWKQQSECMLTHSITPSAGRVSGRIHQQHSNDPRTGDVCMSAVWQLMRIQVC